MVSLMSTAAFSAEVESVVQSNGNAGYMDAILHICDKHGIEIETGAKLVNTVIKKRLEAEVAELNYLKDASPRLPV